MTEITNAGSNQELVQAAQAGNREALDQLLLSYYQQLESHLSRKIGPDMRLPVERDDVLQQTLLSIARGIESYDPKKGSFCNWILTIADNRLTDAVRKCNQLSQGGGKVKVEAWGSGDDSLLGDFLDGLGGNVSLPEAKIRREEAMKALRVGMTDLTAPQRHAIAAYYFEHRDFADIAAELDRTPDAVRELIRRGRERLRVAMGRASRWLDTI